MLVEGVKNKQEKSVDTLYKKLATSQKDATSASGYSPIASSTGSHVSFLNSSAVSASDTRLNLSVNDGYVSPDVVVATKQHVQKSGKKIGKKVELKWDKILASVGVIGAVLVAKSVKSIGRKIIRSVLFTFLVYELGKNFISYPTAKPKHQQIGEKGTSKTFRHKDTPDSLEREWVHAKL